ncbi:MAG: acyl-CoA thioesterase [Planctomycetes bacterium]|jgi:4-hydroxybenzoyl-CoA thioesterase|nr:acyl-CoA thioesterase [Planctomycetota bacterium]MCL4731400.1 acyl-CoA thioesterase [Planctomycetota bacterium]
MALFSATYKIRFSDVDHAGILYYPRFLHYFHCCFEDFFERGLGVPYNHLLDVERIGFPTVHMEVDYLKPLRFGDHVEISLGIQKIGKKSVSWLYTGDTSRENKKVRCVEAELVTVCINMDSFEGIQLPHKYHEAFQKWLVPDSHRTGLYKAVKPEA